MARFQVLGQAQYQSTAEGESADAWLTAWEQTNASVIRNNTGSGHSYMVLDPPIQVEGDVEVCVCQVTYEYHLQGIEDAITPLGDEIACAVMASCQSGTPPTEVVEATCNSYFSSGPEPE